MHPALAVVWTLFLLVAGLGAQASFAGERLALVIGNGAYSEVAPLPNPTRDATLISEALERRAGFKVTRVNDLDGAALKAEIYAFLERASQAGPDAVVLLYYAGHGVQIKDENYLVPVDATTKSELTLRAKAFPLREYMDTVALTGVGMSIVILDACRDNPFMATRGVGTRGLAPVTVGEMMPTFVMFSTAPGKVAEDGIGETSPFSAALAAALAEPGLALDEVDRKVRSLVLAATANQQLTWSQSSLLETHRFAFVEATGPVALAEAAADKKRGLTRPAEAAGAGTLVSGATPATQVAAVANPPVSSDLATPTPAPKELRSTGPQCELDYQDAVMTDTSEGWRNFLAACPDDPRRAEAMAMYRRITEEELWRKVSAEDAPAGYARYLKAFPDGIYARLAKERMESLLLAEAERALPAPPPAPKREPAPRRQPRVTPAADPGFTTERGVDFFGNDIRMLEKTTFAACQAACRDAPGCRALTFNKRARVCFLKSGVGRRSKHKDAVSASLSGAETVTTETFALAPDLLENTDYLGGDYDDIRSISLAGCRTACEEDGRCAGFSYVRKKKWCWLKETLGEPRRAKGIVSGAKF